MTEIKRPAPRVQTKVIGKTMTKHSMAKECDINGIMAKFEKTGLIEHVKANPGGYADLLNMPQSYHEALNQVLLADQMFLTIPANIRAMFDNDPGKLLNTVEAASQDPEARELLRKAGLLTAELNAPSGAPQGAVGEPETPNEGGTPPATPPASQDAP